MKELIRTNDPSVVSFVTHVLREVGIEPFIFDVNVSILEGSIGILPRRILVADEEAVRARKVLQDAGLGHELEKQEG